jgi:hypothetical protein
MFKNLKNSLFLCFLNDYLSKIKKEIESKQKLPIRLPILKKLSNFLIFSILK